MSKIHHIITLFIALLMGSAFFNDIYAQNILPRSTPEAEGLSSLYIQEYFDTLMMDPRTEIHSCIVMRNGKVISELYPKPWRKDYRHTVYSVSKTFTGLAIGMCIEDGLIQVDDNVCEILPEYMPKEISHLQKRLSIKDLLSMQSGIPVDTKLRANEKEWLKGYLAKKPTTEPGSKWAYDSMLSYILSAIVQKKTGKMLMTFLEERLFMPMGITDAAWEESPEGVTCGGWGLYIRPEAMAMLGQLILDGGKWQGKQLVAEEWIREMCSAQSVNGRYGWHLWQCDYPGWSEANGAYGQYIFIIPEQKMVVSMTQCTNKRAPLQRWTKQILADRCQEEALNSSTHQINYTDYTLPLAQGKAHNHELISKEGIRLSLDKNPLEWKNVTLTQSNDTLLLQITDNREHTYYIYARYGTWEETRIEGLPYHTPPPFEGVFSNLPQSWHVASSYAWKDDNTLVMEMHWIDWLTSARIEIVFGNDHASLIFQPRDTGKKVVVNAALLKKSNATND